MTKSYYLYKRMLYMYDYYHILFQI